MTSNELDASRSDKIQTMLSAILISLRHLLGWLVSAFSSREDLILENLALRQQLLALHAKRPCHRLTALHQLFLGSVAKARLYAFIPREWPYLWERLIMSAGQQPATPFPELARASLIHQDIVTYSRGQLVKVQTVIAS